MAQSRWGARIVAGDLPPQHVVSSAGASGGPKDMPSQSGLVLWDSDQHGSVSLTAADALDLFTFLSRNLSVLDAIARHDAQALAAARQQAAEQALDWMKQYMDGQARRG